MRSIARTLLFAVAAIVLLVGGTPANAASRVALIIGNSAYRHSPPLTTPANDAREVASTLTSLGFDVVSRQDVGVDDLRQAVREFAEKSASADISMIYFAGYGVGNGTDGS